MSKFSKYLFLAAGLLYFSINSLHAQSKDSAFKPGGKFFGLAFGDFFYKSHADSLNRGSYQYSKVPKNTNAFQFRRIYLGYTYDISPKFTVDLLLAAESDFSAVATGTAPSGVNTGSAGGDVLQNNNFSFYIKNANVRWKNIWKGTDLIVGEQATPLASQISEPAWAYRSIERTISDFNKSNTSDLGIGLQGKFDPGIEDFGYDLLVANGTKAVPENDNYKWVYADVWGKFLNKTLWVDLYADYNKIGYTGTGVNNPHSRNMYKATIAYTTTPFTFGVEGFINSNKNDVIGVNKTTSDTAAVDASGRGISVYARGQIVKDKLSFFARYDNFNPDSKWGDGGITSYITKPYISGTTTYNVTPVYDVNTKTQFITAGLDFTPVKNVHFMPNIWYVRYEGQAPNLTGAVNHDHDMVWRFTFYYTFGK